MSKFKAVTKLVSGLLGTSAPKINIPEPAIPTPPAPTSITDTGADVSFGSGSGGPNQRVSGRSTARRRTSGTVDILGGLGQSGLSI